MLAPSFWGKIFHGELAQAIALVAYGNRFLHDSGQGPAPELWGSNSTVRNLQVLRFTDADQFAFARDAILLTPQNQTAPWFQDLAQHHARRLLLYVVRGTLKHGLPEIVATAFAGSNRWIIQADFQDRFELWVPSWLPPGLEEKGWSVAYRRQIVEKPVIKPPESLDSYEKELMDAIRANRDFASKALHERKGPPDGLGYFIKMFEKALGLANSADPEPSYPDMIPQTGYPVRSRRLIAVASNAWVFGGMSWWNDIFFNDESCQDEHSRLVAQLYNAVIEGLVAGTNSFETQFSSVGAR